MSGRGLPNPATEPDHAAALLSGWEIALEGIPTGWLDRVFAAAIQAHRGPGLVAAGEVLAAWDGLLTERQAAATHPAPERALPAGTLPVCGTCGGRVWLVDRASGAAGHRALVKCPTCHGQTAPPGTPAGQPEYRTQNILLVLLEFGKEHADPDAAKFSPLVLRWALACSRAGLWADELRRSLEATQAPTLYAALTTLQLEVEPPPGPAADPPAPGGWQRVGDALAVGVAP